MSQWHRVCDANDIDEEDVIEYIHDDKSYAVYNTEKGFFATDGICTHEHQELADGLVIGTVIECPLHQGRFEITNGKALGAPVCVDLNTYRVKVENNEIFIEV